MRTILIVDDGPANRRLLRAVLEAEGMRVVEAADGVEALAVLAREPVDAIISDVLMPNMDGFRLCLEVRQHPQWRRLPFIVLTSTYDSPSDRKLARDAGADEYLVKPAPTPALLAALERAQRRAVSREEQPPPAGREVDIIKQYNAALVAKLEERNAELSAKNEELRASEERFRQLAESIHEVFWLTDPAKSTMLYVSPAYETIWGRSVPSLLQQPSTWLEAIHPDDRERVRLAAAEKQARGDYDEQYRIVRPDGAVRWIRDQAFPVRNAAGEVFRLAGVAADVTEQKQLERQMQQAQKMEAIGTLAGGIAHDFNNILGAIVGYAGLARNELSSLPDVQSHLDAVLAASRRAADLVAQILAFSRMQESRREVIQLRYIVAEVRKLLRATMPATIEFKSALFVDTPPVLGDPTQVHQVMMNLCTNAAHAMRDRKGILEFVLEPVEVTGEQAREHAGLRPGRYARLVISDTGHGMDAETLGRIFEPFFTTKRPGEGTGLGLAVVHGIMQSHDGAVIVHSEPGVGSRFELYFPAHDGAAADPATEGEPTRHYASHGEHILVVDDETAIANVMRHTLLDLGYDVQATSRAEEAWRIFEAAPEAFDLVITDLTMPELTGLELAARMRARRPGMPIILCSGFAAAGALERARQIGITAVLPKPVTVEKLGEIVWQMLRRRERGPR